MINMIASVGKNMELGKDNRLIWRIPEDMKFFKRMTVGNTVVMGRNTYESLPGPLADRKMVVVTSRNIENPDIEIVNNIDVVLNRYLDSMEEAFIIGGARIYREFIDYASNLYLTEINDMCPDADTYFPTFNIDEFDKVILNTSNYKGIDYNICKYKRRIKKY